MWDLIVPVPDHCLSFYLKIKQNKRRKKKRKKKRLPQSEIKRHHQQQRHNHHHHHRHNQQQKIITTANSSVWKIQFIKLLISNYDANVKAMFLALFSLCVASWFFSGGTFYVMSCLAYFDALAN